MKKEKGVITMYVLGICILFISVFLITNMGIINKKTNKEKELMKTIKNYEVNTQQMEQAYQNYMTNVNK